jgi:hypothetical protein
MKANETARVCSQGHSFAKPWQAGLETRAYQRSLAFVLRSLDKLARANQCA